ncbi:aspartate aminotransferase family protein [Paraburkholderia agricolaris]|uniref:aspartate aminotransferase family protein n=1 Tax=Paraburkholderia agricolaris TaxID=2152888 RepID=UPI001291F2B2|nr:aspartate aminotransferase family protein [Paraburkholderia agricolaris]
MTAENSARTTSQWQAADAAHFLHPFTDPAVLAKEGSRIITGASGVYIFDSEGNKLLDGMAGLWNVNVGYGQEALINASHEQMKQLAYYNAFFHTAVPSAIELAENLARVSPPNFKHVYYANSGSEGNDTVIRLVRRYWDVVGQPSRKTIISRFNAYHGSTIGGASLSGMPWMHEQGGLPIPGIDYIQQPHYRLHGAGMSFDEFGKVAASWLEQKIEALGPENVAAFIGEPVQGAGGVIVPPPTYWPEIQRICDKYGILLVSDEVICGFGRTGNWWGAQTFGSQPDLMTFAKGVTSGYVPLGGVMVGERVASAMIEHGGEFRHGYTYAGHPVACAVGVANLKLTEELNLVGKVRNETGPYLAESMKSLQDHPLVGYTEGVGLMWAVQLVKDKANNTLFDESSKVGVVCRDIAYRKGLILRAIGDRMIIAPPLTITKQEIDNLVEITRHCLDFALESVAAAS